MTLLEEQIIEWNRIREWMEKARLREKELREIIAKTIFQDKIEPSGAYATGTLKSVYNGSSTTFNAQLKAKRNITVIEELMVPTLRKAALTPEESSGLIRISYDLSLTAYKKLPTEKRSIVDEMLVVKPGSIELDVTPSV